ncbi:hypothetical protein OHA25_31660 [Nonomuraea sp. NBC_00507]|uniref:hypothetical protein n=1 Tax=Nonomuraea sp. NBC_00507 TaxID=2976002 RepID=UPI002E193DD6
MGVGGVNQPPRVVLADPSNRVLLFRFTPPDPWPKEPAWHLPGLMARVHTTSPATLPWTHEN